MLFEVKLFNRVANTTARRFLKPSPSIAQNCPNFGSKMAQESDKTNEIVGPKFLGEQTNWIKVCKTVSFHQLDASEIKILD